MPRIALHCHSNGQIRPQGAILQHGLVGAKENIIPLPTAPTESRGRALTCRCWRPGLTTMSPARGLPTATVDGPNIPQTSTRATSPPPPVVIRGLHYNDSVLCFVLSQTRSLFGGSTFDGVPLCCSLGLRCSSPQCWTRPQEQYVVHGQVCRLLTCCSWIEDAPPLVSAQSKDKHVFGSEPTPLLRHIRCNLSSAATSPTVHF